MAVQIVKPVDTVLPMSPLTVEAGVETEEEFTWLPLLCCTYGNYHTGPDLDSEEDMDV